MDFTEGLQAILADNTSGSSYLAAEIEKLFPLIPDHCVKETVGEILAVHSSMAAVINKINTLCLGKEGLRPEPVCDSAAREEAFQCFRDHNREKKRWITLSMSYWVTELLAGINETLDLDIGISYPDGEGLKTYEALRDRHNIRVLEDAALCRRVEDADGIILGADLLTENYIVNKTGSFALALAAHYFSKPLYIISSGDKFLTDALLPLIKLKVARHGNRVIDYFEKIPARLISRSYLTSSPSHHPISRTLRQLIQDGGGRQL
ncbi:MAG: hypothetical protein GY765_33630 [bacterium]|nr:hypothetical protein [bacterium]